MSDFFGWIGDHQWVSWVGAAVLLSVIEMMSLDLVLLMFALGALSAAVVAALGAPLWLAILVFAAVSTALLMFARPSMVAKLHRGPTLISGHQGLIGRTGVVLERVDWQEGRIQLASEVWSARSGSASESFEAGTDVLVTQIDGATAVVTGKAAS